MYLFYKMLFFITMIVGTLITISAYSWFSMWLGLEINLMSIIPLFKSNLNLYPAEATLKYFITQTLASIVLLFSIIISLNTTEFITQNYNYWIILIMNSALLTKSGVAPFHSWLPEVTDGLNWMNIMILLTWQKLAPMILISYNFTMNLFFSIIIILSSIIGGILGLNQINLRKIMAYSSINHMAWMLSSMFSSKLIWLVYFLTYFIISVNIMMIFRYFNVYYLFQLMNILNQNKLTKMLFMMNLFSLGGLPPFLGFLPKWLVVNYLVFSQHYLIAYLLVIFTLITLFFYMRICFSALTLLSSETLIKSFNMKNFSLIFFNVISLMKIIICTNLFNFL